MTWRSLRLALGLAATAIGCVYLSFLAGLIGMLLDFAVDWQTGIGGAVYLTAIQVIEALMVGAAWLLWSPPHWTASWSAKRRKWVVAIMGLPGLIFCGYLLALPFLPKPAASPWDMSVEALVSIVQISFMLTATGWLTAGLWLLQPVLYFRRRKVV